MAGEAGEATTKTQTREEKTKDLWCAVSVGQPLAPGWLPPPGPWLEGGTGLGMGAATPLLPLLTGPPVAGTVGAGAAPDVGTMPALATG